MMVSRRTFSQTLAAAVVGGLCASRTSGAERSYPPGKFVDVHTHVGTDKGNGIDYMTAEGLLRWMDANDVAQAWVLPLVSPESFRNPVPTEYTLEQCRPHADRLIPFCSVDPRNSWVGRGSALVNQLKRYIDAGARGFGEHKVGLPVDDDLNMVLYEACAGAGLPLLIHIDNLRNTDRPGLPGLERVLKAFPELKIIGHGPGWWASISGDASDLGGYPRGPITPGGALDALMSKYPNLYGDLSAGSGARAMERDPEFARSFLLRRADRLMFGTDYLAIDQTVPQLELFDRFDLPNDVQRRIFRDNARAMLA